jgi:hypothetical protein
VTSPAKALAVIRTDEKMILSPPNATCTVSHRPSQAIYLLRTFHIIWCYWVVAKATGWRCEGPRVMSFSFGHKIIPPRISYLGLAAYTKFIILMAFCL